MYDSYVNEWWSSENEFLLKWGMRVDWARSLIENLEIPGYVLDRHRGIRTRAGIDANGQFKKNACKQDHPLTGYDYIAARRMLEPALDTSVLG